MNRRTWVIEMIAGIIKSSTAPVQTAEVIVDRLTEEGLLHLGYGDPEIDIVVSTFTDTFGTTKVGKNDRFAARRLVAKYGSQAMCGIIRMLGERSQEKYAPSVGSVAQLEEKIVAVLRFLRATNREEVDI